MPAVLTLMGERMFAWSFGAPRLLSAPWSRLAGAEGAGPAPRRPLRRSGHAGARGARDPGARTSKTGPPDPKFLPADNQARQDLEAIQKAMGPGFPYAFNIVVASRTAARSPSARCCASWSASRSAREGRPGRRRSPARASSAPRPSDLGTLETQLDDSKKLLSGAGKDLGKLEGGLGAGRRRARSSSRTGLREAAAGAGQLADGGGKAADGAGQLRDGLAAARAGSQKISAGLDSALERRQRPEGRLGRGARRRRADLRAASARPVALKEQLPARAADGGTTLRPASRRSTAPPAAPRR